MSLILFHILLFLTYALHTKFLCSLNTTHSFLRRGLCTSLPSAWNARLPEFPMFVPFSFDSSQLDCHLFQDRRLPWASCRPSIPVPGSLYVFTAFITIWSNFIWPLPTCFFSVSQAGMVSSLPSASTSTAWAWSTNQQYLPGPWSLLRMLRIVIPTLSNQNLYLLLIPGSSHALHSLQINVLTCTLKTGFQ